MRANTEPGTMRSRNHQLDITPVPARQPDPPRLTHCERVLALLADGQPHSHHEGYALNVILHSRVSELRKRGYRIEMWRDGDLYLYRLVSTTLSAGEATWPQGASRDAGDDGGKRRMASGSRRSNPRSPALNVERCCVEPDRAPPRAHRDAGAKPSPLTRGGRALQSSELTGRETGSKPPTGGTEGPMRNAAPDGQGASTEPSAHGSRLSRPVSSSPTGQLTLTGVAA